jgi:hypothetical protein
MQGYITISRISYLVTIHVTPKEIAILIIILVINISLNK